MSTHPAYRIKYWSFLISLYNNHENQEENSKNLTAVNEHTSKNKGNGYKKPHETGICPGARANGRVMQLSAHRRIWRTPCAPARLSPGEGSLSRTSEATPSAERNHDIAWRRARQPPANRSGKPGCVLLNNRFYGYQSFPGSTAELGRFFIKWKMTIPSYTASPSPWFRRLD